MPKHPSINGVDLRRDDTSTPGTESSGLHRIKVGALGRARDLRRGMTSAEGWLWARLRGSQLDGLKFRRQKPIGKYIVDFLCADCDLVVEIDGDSHADQVAYDQARDVWLRQQGYTVLRFCNDDVCHNGEGVIQAILDVATERRKHPHRPSP